MANTLKAGAISGDPTVGLCNRVCIEASRVFDGCRESASNRNFTLALGGIPAQAVQPFMLLRAESFGEAIAENVEYGDTANNGCTCVSADLTLPISVAFSDASGARFGAATSIRMHRDFKLRLPEDSVVPFRFKAFASFASISGNFTSGNSVSVSGCYVIIAKIIIPTDILVPSYGNCVYPECENCEDGRCNAFLSLPLFPQ